MTHPTDIGRVAFFLPSLRGGGAERAAANLARGFTERGVAVDMVLSHATGPYLDGLPPEIRVVDFNSPRVMLSLPRMVGYLRREAPGVLIGFMDHANVVALAARSIAGAATRVIGTVHNNKTVQRKNVRGARVRAVMALSRRAYPRLDAVVAVSRGVAESVARESRVPPDDIRVIYNPIVTSELIAQSREIAPEYSVPTILGIGRLDAQKDFENLIAAFAAVRAGRPARLEILGEGPCRGRLESLAKQLGVESEVSLPGFVDNPFARLAHADVFVLSSRWEGLPTVLVEALACRCPVVSTDCPSGPDEILDGGRYGRLVPVEDADALAEAITDTIDSPPERDALGRRAEDFSMDQSVEAYLDLCTSVGRG